MQLSVLPSLACNGARVPELISSDARRTQRERQTSQIARIAGRPSLVTLTIGGNDIGFASVLARCGVSRNCVKHFVGPTGDKLQIAIRNLGGELPLVYRAVRASAPAARVVVPGYPRIFPPVVPGRSSKNCAAWRAFSSAEVRYLNATTNSLNDVIAGAAKRAGVTFVDVSNAFAGHELRCTGLSFVNPFRPRAGVPPYIKSSFHPTALGHARLAEVIDARLRSLTRAGRRAQ